jgi:hypothetical protein
MEMPMYYSIITWCFSFWPSYRAEACCIGLRRSRTPIQQTRGPIARTIWKTSESRANMGRGMITRPIWKCSFIKLFITYFRHLEKWRPYWPETKSRPILGNRLKLVLFPSLGIFIRCHVYCSKLVHTEYPIKIQHFYILCTNILYYILSSNKGIFVPIKQTKWIRHKLNKLMKSSPNYNMLQ